MKNIELVKKINLFKGIDENSINSLLENLDYIIKSYKKGEAVIEEGDEIKYLSIVLSGRGYLYRNLDSGSRLIIFNLKEGDIFGEEYYTDIDYYCNGDLEARRDMEVLHIPWEKLIKYINSNDDTGNTILRNFTKINIKKNKRLSNHLRILGASTLRKKIAFWIMEKVKKQEIKGEVHLNCNRELFAWFLGVSRPSLSRELMKMEDDGLIKVSKSEIKIIDRNGLENLID